MNIIVFEDNNINMLAPFSINHSPIELRIGAFTNLERICSLYGDHNIILIVRDVVENITKERFPDYIINPNEIPQGYCINSSAIINESDFELLNKQKNLSNKDRIISFKLSEETNLSQFYKILNKIDISIKSNINIIENIWDIFAISEEKITSDFNYFVFNNNYVYHPSLIRINEEKIYIGENSIIKAGVILDATKGPIIIDRNAIVDNGSVIEGPTYIGKDSYISPLSKIRSNTIIGPMCKIGGEVTCCNFLGYSNKVHDGFLGHSFIGEWVNIGAGTNNSNLKNNYSEVKVTNGNDTYATKLQFLGTLVGDYTRIAIGTAINTGTYIGFGSNIFNHDITKKYISSFSWGNNERVNLNQFLETVSKMKNRRNKNISDEEQQFISDLYNK